MKYVRNRPVKARRDVVLPLLALFCVIEAVIYLINLENLIIWSWK